jgi:hypothetical protein
VAKPSARRRISLNINKYINGLAETDSKRNNVKKHKYISDKNVRLILSQDQMLSLKLRGKVEMSAVNEGYNFKTLVYKVKFKCHYLIE